MKKLISPFLFFTALLLFNCSDDNESQNASQWYIYQETQCADAWETGLGMDEATVLAAVDTYLNNLGVSISDSAMDNNGQGEACLACTCLSGRRIRVEASVSDAVVLQGENFEVE